MKNFAWLSTVPEEFSGEWSRQAVLLGMIERSGVRVVPGIAINAEVARQFFQQRTLRRKVASLFADALATPTAGLVQIATALRGVVRASSLPVDVSRQLMECVTVLSQGVLAGDKDRVSYRAFWDGHSLVHNGSIDHVVHSIYASQFKPAHVHSQVLHHDLRIIAYPLFLQLNPQVELSGSMTTDRSALGDQTVLCVSVDDLGSYRINIKDGVLLSEHPERQTAFTASIQQALVRIAKKVQLALGELPALRWVATAHGVQIQEVIEECSTHIGSRHVGEVSGVLRSVTGSLADKAFGPKDIVLVDSLDPNELSYLQGAGGVIVVQGVDHETQLTVPLISQVPEHITSSLHEGMFVQLDASRRFINGVSVGEFSAVRTLTTITHLAEQPDRSCRNGLLLTRSHSLLELLGVRAEKHRHEYGAVLTDELLRLASLAAPSPFFYQLHDVHGGGVSRFDAITRGTAGTRALLNSSLWLATEAAAIADACRRGAHNLVPVLPVVHEIGDVELMQRALSEAAPNHRLWESLWITVATPAVAIGAEELVATSPKGVVIDLATLAQLTTGTDASSRLVGHLHQDNHPAVIKMLHFLLATCRSAGVPTIVMAGEVGATKQVVECAVEQGYPYISVLAGQEASMQRVISSLEHAKELRHWLNA